MADGIFTSLVSKDRNANATANPIYVQLSDGTSAIGVTAGALDVNISNASIVVTASDLDIRDLLHTQDSVAIGDGTSLVLDLVTLNSAYSGTAITLPVAGRYQATPDTFGDGDATHILTDANGKIVISNPGGTEYVEDAVAADPATGITTLAERDDALGGITPAEGDWSKLYVNANGALWVKHDGDITIADGGNSITVDGTVAVSSVGGTVTVTASDLDIRDLTHVSDSVSIGDGTTLADVLDGTIDALYTAITDGTDTWSIDGSGYGQVDIASQSLTAVKISKDANANTEINPIFVKVVDTAVSGVEVHDYDTASAVASDATSNHDYTVANTTFFLKSVIVSGSGNIKFEVQTGALAGLATVAVGFLTGRQGDTKQLFFDPPVEVPSTSTGTVRIIRTNRQGAATDLYSTIVGNDV